MKIIIHILSLTLYSAELGHGPYSPNPLMKRLEIVMKPCPHYISQLRARYHVSHELNNLLVVVAIDLENPRTSDAYNLPFVQS